MHNFDSFLKAYFESQEIKTILIDIGIDLFINDFSKTRRPSSISYYKDHLKPFKAFCNSRGIKYFNEINNSFIGAYIQKLKYANNENITINKRVALIKIVMNYLFLNGYISSFELIFPRLEVKPKEIKTISDNQLIELLDYTKNIHKKKRLIILLLISTGIRRNELVNILIKNIDFDNKRIYLDFTKSKKARYIYLNDSLILLIKNVISSNTQTVYLFENKFGLQLEPNYITYLLFSVKKELNFNVLSPHKLRHTYATYLLKNGANQEEVRRLLGHSDFKMTKRYIDYIDNDLQKANNLYNPLNLLNERLKNE